MPTKIVTVSCLTIVFSLWSSGALVQNTEPEVKRLERHASLYKHLDTGAPYNQRKPDANRTVDLSVETLYDYPGSPNPPDPRAELQTLTKLFPLIVETRAGRSVSALTERRSFIHSDWTFTVVKVFKNTTSISVNPDSELSVSRPGGTMDIDGLHLVAHDRNTPPVKMGGTYILMLKQLDDGSFQSSAYGTFEIVDNKVSYLTDPYNKTTSLRAYCTHNSAKAFSDLLTEVLKP